MNKEFKYYGYRIIIRDFKDSWDKQITIIKRQTKIVQMYSYKHIEDAIKQAKKIIKSLKK